MQFRPNRSLMYLQLVGALILAALPAACLAIPLYVFGKGQGLVVPIVVGVFATIAILRILFVLLHFPTIRYEIDDQNVTNSEGMFWRVKRSTPVDKITNVDVRQGPLDRMLGIGQIWIFTPSTGAQMPEARLVGVEDPHRLRARILAVSEDAKSAALHAAAGERYGQPRADDDTLLAEMLETLKRIELLLKSTSALVD